MSPPSPLSSYLRLAWHRSGSIWLGDDHLFIVERSPITERYLRVSFKDIRGIFICYTERRTLWAMLGAAVAFFSGVAVVIFAVQGEWPKISAVLLALALVWLAVNHSRGGGCRAHLLTRVQTLPLPAMRRVPRALAAAKRIEDACRRHQTPGLGP
jgi:hypothetical protein